MLSLNNWKELESAYPADFKPGIRSDRNLVPAVVDLHHRTAASIFRPEAYGAAGDGATDDTAALQKAIWAAGAIAGTVLLSAATYRITAPLVIFFPMTLQGSGVSGLGGSRATDGSDIFLMQAPYLTGSVLLQTTAATDIVQINVTGAAVHLKDFGGRFADPIKFTNTGHGIKVQPPAWTYPGGGTPAHTDIGVQFSQWEGLRIYGHDGSHYAYHLENCQLNTYLNCQSYGGGGWRVWVNTPVGWFGNSTWINPYVCLTADGTAHGYHFGNTYDGHGGIYNVIIRPQCFAWNSRPGIGTAMGTDQHYAIFSDDSWYTNVIGGNFEGAGAAVGQVVKPGPEVKFGFEWNDEQSADSVKRWTFHNYLTSNMVDNAYKTGLYLQNASTGTTALTGITLDRINPDAGEPDEPDFIAAGQVLWVPSNYVNTYLANSVLFASNGQQAVKIIANLGGSGDAQPIAFFNRWNDPAAMVLHDNGKAGIGVDIPAEKLDVGGNVRLSPNSGVNRTITFGNGIGVDAIRLYDGGSEGRYGFGITAGTLQAFIPSDAAFSWRKGGGTQAGTTNEVMKLDAATGLLTVNKIAAAGLPVKADDAAADADVTIPSGGFYQLTGSRAVYRKP